MFIPAVCSKAMAMNVCGSMHMPGNALIACWVFVRYRDFGETPEDHTLVYDTLELPDPKVVMLDLLDGTPPKNDVGESHLCDWWTSTVCAEAHHAIIAKRAALADTVRKLQSPALRGLVGQVVWAQEEKFAYWPGLVLDPTQAPDAERSRWLTKAMFARKKAVQAAKAVVAERRRTRAAQSAVAPIRSSAKKKAASNHKQPEATDKHSGEPSEDGLDDEEKQELARHQTDIALVYWLVDERFVKCPWCPGGGTWCSIGFA